MTLTIQVPAELELLLKAEAQACGLAPETLVVQRLSERYARARAQAQTVLSGRFRPQAEVEAELRARLGIADLSHLSENELDARMQEALHHLSPEKIAEAQRQGLLSTRPCRRSLRPSSP